ncbi:uncharacterized protein LY89DRAFT_713415 [Mollisia scopiformis]|uniref:Oxidoreductase FAD/NAD(P)-binding domain-containing protein n=1 Tax=Mollisia scopiformis TaxID=149040 RepID=A0A194XWC9_MOLSC|nr:uncharacterized protein LY89DRAFT_713415 [Mollisia scopiformis]KUJ24605.1 hypothetical protein LY89DRAFT_713415 [Mollisia scopiformis]
MASVVEAQRKTLENTIKQGEPLLGLVGSDSEFDSDSQSESDSKSYGGNLGHKSRMYDNMILSDCTNSLNAPALSSTAELIEEEEKEKWEEAEPYDSQGLSYSSPIRVRSGAWVSGNEGIHSSTRPLLYPRAFLMKLRQQKSISSSEQLPISMTPITPNSATFMVDPSTQEDEEEGLLDTKRSKMVSSLSFLIRREKGTTALLFTDSLKVLVPVEGPYSSQLSLASLPATAPHLVCIAGGVGIAPILPVLRARANASTGSTRLYLGARSKGLLLTCGPEYLQRESTSLDIQVRIGKRWDMEELVWREAGCYEPGSYGNGADTLIIVCGPASMIDDVRWAVVEANKRCKRGIGRLLDESFG